MSYVIVCMRLSPKRYLFLNKQGNLTPFFDTTHHGWKPYAKVFETKQEANAVIEAMENKDVLGAMPI